MSTKPDPNFFKFPKPVAGTLVALLMVVFYHALANPEGVFLDYCGPLGTLARYLNKEHMGVLKAILYGAVAAHLGEAVYAGKLCQKKGINTTTTMKWVIQTFIMGFPSLLQLVAYKPNRKQV